MENPTFFHLLTSLYIGFAQLSNNEIPLEEEIALKRKIAQWMDLSYRNVDQYEMIMRESLEWFNSVDEKNREEFILDIAENIAKVDEIDELVVKKILSEIRDIAISNGKFDQGEKMMHDKIAAKMGLNITTIDDHCEPLQPKNPKKRKATKGKNTGQIGFRYGSSKDTES